MLKRHKLFGGLLAATLIGGLMSSAMAQTAKLRMGVLLPVSGPLSFVGVTMKESLDLVVEQFNAKGGMSGHQIEVVFYDTESNTTLVGQQFRRLVESDKVDIVVGPTVTGESLVARGVANELKVPVVPFAGTEAVINPTSPYLFAFVPSDRQVAQAMLQLAKAQGLKSVAFLHSADGFGQTGLKVMKELTAEMGIGLAAVEEFGPRDADMTPQVMRIRASSAEGMFVWGVNPGPTIIMKNAKAVGFNKPIMNSYGVASQLFIKQTGEAGEGTYVAGTAIMGALQMNADDPIRKATEPFIAAFEKRYNKPVAAFNGYVFDAINLVDQAIKKTGGKIDRESLAKAFRDGGLEYTGANGKLRFPGNSSTAQSPNNGAIVMLKINKGAFELVR